MTPVPPSSSEPQLPGANLSDIVAHLRERDIMWFGSSDVTEREMGEYIKLARAMVSEAVADQRPVPIQGSVITVFHPFGDSNDAIKYTFSENCTVTQTEECVFFTPVGEDDEPDCISLSRKGLMIHVAPKRQILASDVGVAIVRDGKEEVIYHGEDLSKVIETTIEHAPQSVRQAVEKVDRKRVPVPTMHAFPSMGQNLPMPVPRQPEKDVRDIPSTGASEEEAEE